MCAESLKLIVVRSLLIDAGGTVKLGGSVPGRRRVARVDGRECREGPHAIRSTSVRSPRQPRFTNLARKTGAPPSICSAEDAKADRTGTRSIRAGSVAAPRECRARPAWSRGHSLPDRSRDTPADTCEAQPAPRRGSIDPHRSCFLRGRDQGRQPKCRLEAGPTHPLLVQPPHKARRAFSITSRRWRKSR
jgi:hypothetical protein